MELTRLLGILFVFAAFELLCANAGPIPGDVERRSPIVTQAVGVVPVEVTAVQPVPLPSSRTADALIAAAKLYNMLPSLPSLPSLPEMPSFSMPNISLPDISLPSMPDISLPSMPNISMPDIKIPDILPDIKMPDIKMPDISLPKMPDLPDMTAAKAWASDMADAASKRASAAYNSLPSMPVVTNPSADTTTTVEVVAVAN